MKGLQMKYETEVSKNTRLSSECQHYIDKFRRMEETMKNLYREIDQLKLLVISLILIVNLTFS